MEQPPPRSSSQTAVNFHKFDANECTGLYFSKKEKCSGIVSVLGVRSHVEDGCERSVKNPLTTSRLV